MERKISPYLAITIFTLAHSIHHIYAILIPPLLPIFKLVYHLTYFQAGLLISLFNIGLINQLLVGVYSDKKQKRKIFVGLGLVFSAFLVVIVGLTETFLTLAIIVFLLGIVASTYHPPGTTLVTEYFPPQKRGRFLGIHLIGGSTGTALGPILIGGLATYLGWKHSLYLLSIPGILIGLTYLTLIKDIAKNRKQPNLTNLENITDFSANFQLKEIITSIIILFLALFLGLIPIIGLQSFLTLYLTDIFNLNISFAAMLLGLMQIAGILSSPIGGWISDKTGRKPIIVFSLTIQPILVYLLLQTSLGIPMYGILFLLGFFFYALLPAASAYLADITPPRLRGTIYAIYFTASFGWIAFIQLLTGNLIDILGFKNTFTTLTLTAFGGVVLSLLIKHKRI